MKPEIKIELIYPMGNLIPKGALENRANFVYFKMMLFGTRRRLLIYGFNKSSCISKFSVLSLSFYIRNSLFFHRLFPKWKNPFFIERNPNSKK